MNNSTAQNQTITALYPVRNHADIPLTGREVPSPAAAVKCKDSCAADLLIPRWTAQWASY